jgi:hypothetical protein
MSDLHQMEKAVGILFQSVSNSILCCVGDDGLAVCDVDRDILPLQSLLKLGPIFLFVDRFPTISDFPSGVSYFIRHVIHHFPPEDTQTNQVAA